MDSKSFGKGPIALPRLVSCNYLFKIIADVLTPLHCVDTHLNVQISKAPKCLMINADDPFIKHI